jgi:DNA-binding NarL/FixJ family response regulator
MPRPRVLLADDHRILAQGLKSLLSADFDLAGVVEDGRAMGRNPFDWMEMLRRTARPA